MMIITNCPAREDLYDMTGDYDENDLPIMVIDTPDYCVKYKKACDKVENCVVKCAICNKNVSVFEVNNVEKQK